jgi:gluconolactonase
LPHHWRRAVSRLERLRADRNANFAISELCILKGGIMKNNIKRLGFAAAALLLAALRLQAQGANEVVRLDPALDQIISSDTKVEKLAGGFGFVEGPVWVRQGGYLLFSDIPANAINKWTPDGKVAVFLKPSGFTGSDPSDVGSQNNNGQAVVTLLGSNGVTLDRQGRVVFCAHGDRDVVRIEKDGKRTVLADRFEGKRLNSPNDLVFKSDGALYFTDPSAGLRKRDDDPKKELPFNGVYLLKDGKLQLLEKTFATPNGIALAPGEKYLYVNDTTRKLIMRYELRPDDTIGTGKVFIDMSADTAAGVPDGMKVDQKGNVYCTGPGGFWIMSPEGKHLGTVKTPELPANLAWGDADAKALYLTARTGLYRIRLKVAGIRP